MTDKLLLTDRDVENIYGIPRSTQAKGRIAALHDAGDAGITALEVSTWALRLAHYVMKLKKLGLSIDMVREKHAGPVLGWHGRYILCSGVQILEQDRRPV
jgi:hypothetical protein